MTSSAAKHVFISYVREDSADVDRLCKLLEAAKIPYWRDRKDLGPGDAWKTKIRDAIRSGTAAFVPCFSAQQRVKGSSYMNEELVEAVDQFRRQPPNKTWLIPVRFDDGEVDEWELGAGRRLSDYNYVDLFGEDYAANAIAFIAKINDVLGGVAPDSQTVLASIEEAANEERPTLLRNHIKALLLDPGKRIEVDELIMQELKRTLRTFHEDSRFPSKLTPTDGQSLDYQVASVATEYWSVVEPLCWSLQVAARYSNDEGQLTPWVNVINELHSFATAFVGGSTALARLRYIPLLAVVVTAAISATSAERWNNFRVLLVDLAIPHHYSDETQPVLEAVSFHAPFREAGDYAPSILANSVTDQYDLRSADNALTERKIGKRKTPISDWLCTVLRPAFSDHFVSGPAFEVAFDRAEIMLGLASQDIANLNNKDNPDRPWPDHSSWFGRSTWRTDRSETGSPIAYYSRQLSDRGHDWPPLRAGLFGGQVDRASNAITEYGAHFNEVRSKNRF